MGKPPDISQSASGLQIARDEWGDSHTNDDIRRSRFGYEESPGKAGG